MMTFTPTWTYLDGCFVPNVVLTTTLNGTILNIERTETPPDAAKRLDGILVPGFVNAHCHLELSYLSGIIPQNTGMVGFINSIMTERVKFSKPQQIAACQQAIKDAFSTGTIAIYDICNADFTATLKSTHPALKTYSFIELFSLDPDRADTVYEYGLTLLKNFAGLPSALTLHAPYSISTSLRDKVYQFANTQRSPLSLHCLESEAEQGYFDGSHCGLRDLFRSWGLAVRTEPGNLLDFLLTHLPPVPTLFVHLTSATAEQLDQIASLPQATMVLCPRSNLFIHNKLPNLALFTNYHEKIAIGTDSLASNYDLNLVKELVCLQDHYPSLSTEKLIQFGTLNGAKALGWDNTFGKLAVKTNPGLVLLEHLTQDLRFTQNTTARMLVPPID